MAESTWWERVQKYEPARVRYLIILLVSLLALWGIDLAGFFENVGDSWELIYQGITVIVTGEVIRQGVTPKKAVVARELPNGAVVNGPAGPKHRAEDGLE